MADHILKRLGKDVDRTWHKIQDGDQRKTREQRVQAKWQTCQEAVREIRDKLSETGVASSGKEKSLDPPTSPFSEDLKTNIVRVLDALGKETQSAFNQGISRRTEKSFDASAWRDAGEKRLDALVNTSEQLKQDFDTWSRTFGIQKDTPSRELSRRIDEAAEPQFKAVLDGYEQFLKSTEATSQTDEGTLDRARQAFSKTVREIEEKQSDQPESSHVRQQDMLSGHETVHDRSIEHIPPEVLAASRKTNKEIAEHNARFEAAHSKHLANSKREILQTATIALERVPEGQPKKALLLGVGNGLDTPLRELAEKFDQLTLVELDKESTEEAIKQLSPELQKKCMLVVADVTGIVGELCKEIKDQVNTSDLPQKLVDTLAEKTNEAKKKVTESTPDLGTDYAFASSQLVLSQLSTTPHDYIRNTMKDKFGIDLSTQPHGDDHALFMNCQSLYRN
jgi:hypothetical protein